MRTFGNVLAVVAPLSIKPLTTQIKKYSRGKKLVCCENSSSFSEISRVAPLMNVTEKEPQWEIETVNRELNHQIGSVKIERCSVASIVCCYCNQTNIKLVWLERSPAYIRSIESFKKFSLHSRLQVVLSIPETSQHSNLYSGSRQRWLQHIKDSFRTQNISSLAEVL